MITDYKIARQREILKRLAKELDRYADEGSEEDVETILDTLEENFLDVLGDEDFFGTEGWEHMLGLDN